MSAAPSFGCTQPLPLATVLHPGDVACVGRGERLETLLGSCVAVVLTDPRRTVGAMCHIVHAGAAHGAPGKAASFGSEALQALFKLLRKRGIEPRLCEAFVYGGGNMFPALFTRRHVGDENVRWVLDALASEGIAVHAHDHGGATYRRLVWTVGPTLPQVRAVQV
ncbi:chemotaxis protein CheD [Rubrivivax sp. RP6-9]|uniref:chemotaxis protein CheD n=1 Tax=Rubrivivax sp. RP6-9 TaxID=3415750 RepID=UPI003CC646F6